MIISDKYHIIFIHIPKNAGTYITTLLFNLDPNIKRYTKNGNGHIKAKDCIEIIGLEKFNKYTKICVVRNIFDKIYSLYNYTKNDKKCTAYEIVKNMPFIKFIEIYIHDENCLNLPYIVDRNGKVLVDNIIKFENLDTELNRIFDFLNIDISGCIPPSKINQYGIGTYGDKYNLTTINMVKLLAKEDIDFFNFTVPSTTVVN